MRTRVANKDWCASLIVVSVNSSPAMLNMRITSYQKRGGVLNNKPLCALTALAKASGPFSTNIFLQPSGATVPESLCFDYFVPNLMHPMQLIRVMASIPLGISGTCGSISEGLRSVPRGVNGPFTCTFAR